MNSTCVKQVSMDWESSRIQTRGCLKRSSTRIIEQTALKRRKIEEPAPVSLPNEMLLEIFIRLDTESLKKCALVCRKWHQIITQSLSTMEKLPLMIGDSILIEQKPKLTRRYSEINMEETFNCSNSLLRELKRIGEHVKILNLTDCVFYEREFIRLCRCFPNLETLVIRWCSMGIGVKKTSARPAVLKNLKNLTLWGEGWMLDHLVCNVENLVLNRFYVDHQRGFVNFLNAQNNLRSLELANIDDLFEIRRRNEKIEFDLKFQLEEVILKNLKFADEKHLIKLLENARNASSVELGYDCPPAVAREVIRKFRNLDYLYIDADLLTEAMNFSDIPHNTTLKTLEICGRYHSNTNVIGSFISLFPNLEYLDLLQLEGLGSTNYDLWFTMFRNIKKLKSLALNRLTVFNIPEIKFPMLKELTVDKIGYTNSLFWEGFARNNPVVETLMIKSTPVQIFYGADILGVVKSLKHLEYYRNFHTGPFQPFAMY